LHYIIGIGGKRVDGGSRIKRKGKEFKELKEWKGRGKRKRNGKGRER